METELINSPISNNDDTDYQQFQSPFIEANTELATLEELQQHHIILTAEGYVSFKAKGLIE